MWNSKDLSIALDITIDQNLDFEYGNQVKFNSKHINKNDIFVALKINDNAGDGHDYIVDAINSGASLCIVSNIPNNLNESHKRKLLIVKDTFASIYSMAKYKRDTSSNKKFIGITGSVGKTSTKEFLKCMTPNSYCSSDNFNNHIGMPLNLASIPLNADYCILELAMNRSNEISPLSNILRPDIAIITNVSMSHVGNFSSVDDIAHAKSEIFDGMDRESIAILPSGSKYITTLIENAKNKGIKNIFTFGKEESAHSKLIVHSIENDVYSLKYKIFGKEVSFKTKIRGEHNALNIASCLLCCELLGLNLENCVSNLSLFSNISGRGDIHKINFFDKVFHIIDDSYNANPESMNASLLSLKNMNNFENKVVVISDMLELGNDSVKYHESLSDSIIDAKPKMIITVGDLMKNLHRKLMEMSKLKSSNSFILMHFSDYNDLYNNLNSVLFDDHLYLFKGSKGTKLRSIVDYLKTKQES